MAKPLVLKRLLEVQANFCVATEWVPIDNAVARKEITKRKRHFNVSKSSFISSVHSNTATMNPRDVLIHESKQADIENLGDCLRVLGDGQILGDFSLTIVLYADDKKTLDRVLPGVVRIFTSADGSLLSDTYNSSMPTSPSCLATIDIICASCSCSTRTLRTFRSFLRSILARHGTGISTASTLQCLKPLDLYAQAGMPNKRLAQSKLVRLVLNKGEAQA